METAENLNVRITADNSDFLSKLSGIKSAANSVMGGLSRSMKGFTSGNMKSLQGMVNSFKGLGNASSAAGSAAEGAMSGMAEGAAGAAAAVAAVAAVVVALVAALKALVDIGKKTAELGDRIDKMSQKLNMSSAAFQKWDYFMNIAGSSADNLKAPITTMIKNANSGSAAFDRLGISTRDANGQLRDSTELFDETVTALAGMANTTERNALATQIFGKQASNLYPILNGGAEGLRNLTLQNAIFGANMSAETARLSAQYKDLQYMIKSAAQGIMVTIGAKVLPYIVAFCKWVAKALAYAKTFFQTIFGVKGATQEAGTQMSKSYTKAAVSTNNYTNSIKKATKAVKELKRQTMGFDEMNILSSTKSNNLDSGIPTVSPDIGDVGDVEGSTPNAVFTEEELDSLSTKLDNFRKKLEAFKNGFLDLVWKPVQQVFTSIGELFEDFWKWFQNTTAFEIFKDAWKNIKEGFSTCWDGVKKIWEGVCTFFSGIVDGIKAIFNGDFAGVKEAFSKAWDGVKEIWDGVKEYFEGRVKVILGVFEGIGGLIVGYFEAAVQFFQGLGQVVKDAWDEGKAVFKTWWDDKIKPKLTKDYWKDKFKSVTSGFKEKWDESAIGKLFNGTKSVTANLKAKVQDLAPNTRKLISKTWDKIKGKTSNLNAKVKDGAKRTREKMEAVWNKFKNKKAELTATFKDNFTSAIKRVWNGLVRSINKAINFINKHIPGATISTLKELAVGGIATSATPALIGEAGAEAVLPLENNTGWMDMLADRINGRAPSKIVLMVDGRQLGYATIDSINDITRTSGSLKLQLV